MKSSNAIRVSLKNCSESFKKANPVLCSGGRAKTTWRLSKDGKLLGEYRSESLAIQAREALCGLNSRDDYLIASFRQIDNPGAITAQRRGKMNKTEAEYALILEAQKQRGDILRYEYEGITLRWAGIKYTPDFVVFVSPDRWDYSESRITFIEIKGGWTGGKYERAIERFRHARTYWPEFKFEMHQRQKGGQWKRIY